MSINSNNNVLDIINGVLRVSSIDIKQTGGFTTALNTVARNDVLLYDDQDVNTTFIPQQGSLYRSATGVTRDTTANAGYVDLNDGWVYWPLQLPNAWHTEFDMHVTTTGGVLTYSLFNTTEPNHTDYTANDGGYKIVFDNTQNQIDIRWQGSVHATTSANIRSADWQHVNINYFQGSVSISLAGKVVLTHKFAENYQEFDSRYIGFSATTGASHKIRHLIVHNGDKWLYTKTSNASDISYVSGNVGIGTLAPTELLDVHGNVHIAKDLTVDGNLTVSGTTTFIDTQNLAIEDPIIEVAKGNVSDTIDAGLVIARPTANVAVAYRGDEDELALAYTQSGASETDVVPLADGGLDVRVYGNVFANNLTTTANVEATYLKGDGSELTGITLESVVDYGNVTSNTIQLTNADVGLKATGNVEANYFVGDGSKLTGLVTDLQSVTDNGNVTSNTVQFTNATTAFYAVSNVGIGTSTPSANLQVVGYQYVNDPPSESASFDHSDAPLTLTHSTPTSTTAIDDPKAVLHLTRDGTQGTNYGSKASFKMSRYENSGTASRSRLDVTLTDGTYTESNVMSLRGDGKVGVGTTNPGYTLDVAGDINLSGSFYQGGAPFVSSEWTTGTDSLYYRSNVEVGTGNLFVDTTTSNVGIGTTTPAYELDVVGNVNFTGDLYQGGAPFVSSLWTDGPDSLYYRSNVEVGTGNLFVDTTTSNVGIGTTTPAYTLDVAGTANAYTVKANTLHLDNFLVSTTYGLDHVTNENNSTGDTIISTNGVTGFQASSNIVVGGDIHLTGNIYQNGTIFTGGSGGIDTTQTLALSNVTTGLTVSSNAVITGNVTAGSFIGDGSQLTGVGIDTTQTLALSNVTTGLTVSSNAVVTGNVTAGSFIGDGSQLTGVGIDTTQTLALSNVTTGLTVVSNVGIGTTNPSQKLDVNGSIIANSYRNAPVAFRSYVIEVTSSATASYMSMSDILTQTVVIPDEIDISTTTEIFITWNHFGEIDGPSVGENVMFDITVTPSGGSATRLGSTQEQNSNRGYGIGTWADNYYGEESSTPHVAVISGKYSYTGTTRNLTVKLVGMSTYSSSATIYTNRTGVDSNDAFYERGISTLACMFYK